MANAEFSLPNLRAVMMANPSITAGELAQNFGVSVDTINNALSLDTSSWDQSVLDYYNQLENYRKQMEEQGFFLLDPRQQGGYFEPKTGMFVNTSFIPEAGVSIPSIYGPANQDYYRSMMGQYTDPSQFYQTVMMYKNPTEKGQSEYFGSVVADPNKQYRLVDTNNGQVVYSGTGLEALQKINQLVPSISGKPSESWSLDVADPGSDPSDFKSGSWQPTGVQKINSDTPGFMKALGAILPIATAFIPGLNVLGTIATQAASGAIGSGMAGRDPLTGALIGGLTAGALKAPILSGGQSISGALGQAVGAGGKGAVEAAAQSIPGEIVVTAAPKIFEQAINAAAQGGVGALSQLALDTATQKAIDQYAGQAAQQQPLSAFDRAFPPGTDFSKLPAPEVGGGLSPSAFNDIVVNAYRPASTGFISSGIPGIAQSGLSAAQLASQVSPNNYLDQIEQAPQDTGNISEAEKSEILVSAKNGNITDALGKIIKIGFPAAGAFAVLKSLLGSGASATANTAQAAANVSGLPESTAGITVVGNPAFIDPVAASIAGGAATAGAALSNAAQQAAQEAAQAGKGPLTLSNALKAAALVSGLAGAGGGGGGAASSASRPLGSIFSAQLPTTSKIATARQPFAVMPDMTRYGRGTPSLAAQVPQYGGVMPPGFNPDTMEWLGPQKEEPEKMAWGGYAEGGVDGPGDGRSDSIPAQLSDGEYVIDAETVALLGNGSNKAGAKKLDQFRVNIRKSKGKHLARGKFSVNAKRPESYLGAR